MRGRLRLHPDRNHPLHVFRRTSFDRPPTERWLRRTPRPSRAEAPPSFVPEPPFTQPPPLLLLLLLMLMLLWPRQAEVCRAATCAAGSIADLDRGRQLAGEGPVAAAAAAAPAEAIHGRGGGDAYGWRSSPRAGSEALQASQLRFKGLHLRDILRGPRVGRVAGLNQSPILVLSPRSSVYVAYQPNKIVEHPAVKARTRRKIGPPDPHQRREPGTPGVTLRSTASPSHQSTSFRVQRPVR